MKIGLVYVEFVGTDETRREILSRRLRTLISAVEGVYPLNRRVGLSQDILDMPVPAAITLMSVEIYKKVEEYLPEIEVEDIDCQHDESEDTVSVKVICRAADAEDKDSLLDEEAEEDEDYERD